MLSSRQSLYMMEKLHFFIKSIKKDVVQKRDKSSTVQNVFCTTMHFRNELLLEIEHMIWAPQLPSNKSKKTSNFLQLFCWKLYRNFFSFFFLKELFLVEIENLLRISKENREKARTEIKIQGNPIKNEFGNIWVGFRKWKLLANSAIQDILILSWAV